MNNLKNSILLFVLLFTALPSVASELITVEEAEKRYKDILHSRQEPKEKLEQLKVLKQLLNTSREIDLMLNPQRNKKNVTSPSPVAKSKTESENNKELEQRLNIKEGERRQEQALRLMRIRELSTTYDSGFYMSEYVRIGKAVSADLIVNGSSHKNIDINNAIKNKKVFDGYRIIAEDSRELIVYNTRTKETSTVNQRSSEEIMTAMAFNHQLVQKYAEAVLMGELEVELKAKVNATKETQDPLAVSYPTAAMPTPYDSSN